VKEERGGRREKRIDFLKAFVQKLRVLLVGTPEVAKREGFATISRRESMLLLGKERRV